MPAYQKKSYVPPEPSPLIINPPMLPEPISAAPVAPDVIPAPAPVEMAAEVADATIENVEKAVKEPTAAVSAFQEKIRDMMEKGLSETRSNFVKAKSAADDAASAFEASFTTAKTGVAEINAKALDAWRGAAEANFDFLKSVLGVKSMADYVALHSEFARKQVEMATGTSKEFSALAKKVAEQSVEPIKAQVAKTFKIAV